MASVKPINVVNLNTGKENNKKTINKVKIPINKAALLRDNKESCNDKTVDTVDGIAQ